MIVSYAQNYEDVMLLRALGDVERGFYVDIGAQDPIEDSVTRLFYENGWRGINAEPVPHWHQRLEHDRPDDVNLRVLVGDRTGSATIYEVVGTGLSTMDASLAASHAAAGKEVIARPTECVTLDSILARFAPADIHFLKIDVEGAEAQVLRGLSLRRYRPWVLVIESCAPNSRIETHSAWEPDVLDAGYRLVYRDGLNRFYLAHEHASREQAFAVPPNVLDDFIRHGEWSVRNELALLEVASGDQSKRIEILHATVAQRDEQLRQWSARAGELSAQAERLQHALDVREEQWKAANAEWEASAAEWKARAAGFAETIERVQRLADGRQAQLVEAAKAAARELAMRDEKLASLRVELMAVHAERELIEMEARRHEALLGQIISSRSWRLTRPLRVLGRLLRHGPGELIGAARARLGRAGLTGPTNGEPGAAASGPPTASPEPPQHQAAQPGAADPLSDRGEAALMLMDRARAASKPDPEAN